AGRNDRTADVQSSFQKALDVARRQNALSMELRAAVSAVQFVWRQSKSDRELANARSILQPICGLFTEGFETFDWHAAASLLDAWARVAGLERPRHVQSAGAAVVRAVAHRGAPFGRQHHFVAPAGDRLSHHNF